MLHLYLLLSKIVLRYPFLFIIVILILTLMILPTVLKLKFETSIESYMPDNEISRAYARANNYFGKPPKVQFILVKSTAVGDDNSNNNILTPASIREQYTVLRLIDNYSGVDSVFGIATIIDQLCKYNFTWISITGPDHTQSIATRTDEQIRFRIELMLKILNGSAPAIVREQIYRYFKPETLTFYTKLLFSKDFSCENPTPKATLIIVYFNGSLSLDERKKLASKLYFELNGLKFKYIRLSQTGEDLMAFESELNTARTHRVILVAIFAVITIILLLFFRKFTYVIIPILLLVTAIIWTYATIHLIGIPLLTIMIGVLPLMFGLGVDYPIHINEHYLNALRIEGKSYREAMELTLATTGVAISICAITTIVGFASNLSSNMTVVRDFGVTCALGIFFLLIFNMFFYVPCRFILDSKFSQSSKVKPASTTRRKVFFNNRLRIKSVNGVMIINQSRKIIVAVMIITIVAVAGASQLRSEFSIKDFLPSDWETVHTETEIFKLFEAGSYTQTSILLEGRGGADLARVEVLNAVATIVSNFEDDKYVVKFSIAHAGNNDNNKLKPYTNSILELIKHAVDQNSTLISKFNLTADGLPSANCTDNDIRALFLYLYTNTTPLTPFATKCYRDEFNRLVHYNRETDCFDAMIIHVYLRVVSAEELRIMYQQLIANLVTINNTKLTPTGMMILTITTLDALQWSQIVSTGICMIIIAIMLIIIRRNIVVGLLHLIPVSLSTIWILGVMYMLQIPINVLTVTVTALGIGMGIDYAIHVGQRFKYELAKNKNLLTVTKNTIERLARPLTISAVTTIAGFIVLMLAPMPIMNQYGIICALSLFFSFITSLLVLPNVLYFYYHYHRQST